MCVFVVGDISYRQPVTSDYTACAGQKTKKYLCPELPKFKYGGKEKRFLPKKRCLGR
jgi:hypothetical protein